MIRLNRKAYKLRLKRVLIVTFRQFPIVKIKQVSQTENREKIKKFCIIGPRIKKNSSFRKENNNGLLGDKWSLKLEI